MSAAVGRTEDVGVTVQTASARHAPRVLAVVRLVPRGSVVSYGDLAELFAVNPRLIGRVMSLTDGEAPWWRVTNSHGDVPGHLRAQAFARWAQEGITVKPNGLGCRIGQYRTDLAELAEVAEAELGPLPGLGGVIP